MTPALPVVLQLAGGRSAIAFKAGRKHLHAVVMGTPVHLQTFAVDASYRVMELKGKPYPVRRAARRYLRSELEKTDRATRILRAIARGETEIRT